MVKTYARHVLPVDMINFRHAHKIDDNHYKVYGRDGAPYEVFVSASGQILCPCHAGVHNNPCFHAAVVFRRLVREKRIG